MSKQETVEVTVKLPKQIAKYLQTFENENLTEAITFIVVDHVRADVEAADHKMLMTAYNLEPIFKKYGVTK